MKHIPVRTLLAAAVAGAMLAACGGSSDAVSQSGSGGTAATVTGTFLDSAVEGLEYVAGSSAKAATNANGEFTCKEGETVTFSIGGITIGSATCAMTITPQTLAGGANVAVSDDKVVNRLMLLQLLDEDNDPSNGIKLAADVKAALASGATLDFTTVAGAFNTALTNVLAKLADKYKDRGIDDDRRRLAREHFEDTLASRLGRPLSDTVSQTHALGAVSASITRYQIQSADKSMYIPYEGSNTAIKAEFPLGFLPSYGSGLAFKGTNANGDLEFYGLTDRGPNGDGPNVPSLDGVKGSKIFPSPSFTPSLGIITIGKNGAVLRSTTPLIAKDSDKKTTGQPIPFGAIGNSAEVPVTDSLKYEAAKATFDINGLDTEAVLVDKKRNVLWISDEYGPFIAKINPATGKILAKYDTSNGLPTIFNKRRANRGMEGLALDTTTDKLHGFLQSPLSDGKAYYAVTKKNEDVEKFAGLTRWIEFDPTTGATTRMYAYPIDGAEYDKGRTGNAKLGDVVALGNGKFIVIEQGAGADGKVFNKLVLVEIGNATDIGAAGFNPATSDLEKSSMGAVAVNGADWASVVPLKKTVLFDLNKAGWLAEKAEGLTVVDDYTLALANDNDFGLSTRIFDKDGKVVSGADITKCTVDANGALTTTVGETGCEAGNTARVARGSDGERPSRLWLIKFSKALSSFSVPAK